MKLCMPTSYFKLLSLDCIGPEKAHRRKALKIAEWLKKIERKKKKRRMAEMIGSVKGCGNEAEFIC